MKGIKINSIKNLIIKSIKNDKNNLYFYELGTIPNKQIKSIKSKFKIDLSGYNRVIDNYSIKHILIRHGNEKQEAKKGQIAITLDKFELIPKVLNNPDEITVVGKNKIGNNVIKYTKKINDIIICIEEISGLKTKIIGLQTMYIKKAKKNT